MPHPFLSPEWIEAARLLRDEYREHVPPIEMSITVNVIVSETPFDAESTLGHIDTSSGALVIDDGHLETADLTVEVGYELARELFIERDFTAAMQAFMTGEIKVTGDSSKLLKIQPPPPDSGHPRARELAARIDEITE